MSRGEDLVRPRMEPAEVDVLEDILGLRVADFPHLFHPYVQEAAGLDPVAHLTDPSRGEVHARWGEECLIAYRGGWMNTRGRGLMCSGRSEVTPGDHLIPLISNRVRKEMGERAANVPSQFIGSSHRDNVIPACQACNRRKSQKFEVELIGQLIIDT